MTKDYQIDMNGFLQEIKPFSWLASSTFGIPFFDKHVVKVSNNKNVDILMNLTMSFMVIPFRFPFFICTLVNPCAHHLLHNNDNKIYPND